MMTTCPYCDDTGIDPDYPGEHVPCPDCYPPAPFPLALKIFWLVGAVAGLATCVMGVVLK